MIIPEQAKDCAKEGLKKVSELGLVPKECKETGIYVALSKADKILKNKYLDQTELKKIADFYKRNRKNKTKECQTAIFLCGGEDFTSLLSKIY